MSISENRGVKKMAVTTVPYASPRVRSVKEILSILGGQVGSLATIVQIAAYVQYMYLLVDGVVHTNPVSWILWLGETSIGLAIYIDRTRDMKKWAPEAAALVGVFSVTGYLTWQSTLGKSAIIWESVDWTVDGFAAGFAIFAFLYWFFYRENVRARTAAVWIFQLALIAAAIPLIRATAQDPSAEPLMPWLLWTLSFALQMFAAALRWDGWTPLLNPLNYAITHGWVAWIILMSAAP